MDLSASEADVKFYPDPIMVKVTIEHVQRRSVHQNFNRSTAITTHEAERTYRTNNTPAESDNVPRDPIGLLARSSDYKYLFWRMKFIGSSSRCPARLGGKYKHVHS